MFVLIHARNSHAEQGKKIRDAAIKLEFRMRRTSAAYGHKVSSRKRKILAIVMNESRLIDDGNITKWTRVRIRQAGPSS